MATELAGIRRAIRDPESRGLCLYVSGIGKKATIVSIDGILQTRPNALILVGFCGGANPDLRTGDLHIASSFCHYDEDNSVNADAELSSAMLASAGHLGVNVASGLSVTVGNIAGPSAKAELHHSDGVASVNMEDYWAASAAAAAGMRFASVRAVLDTAGQSLPEHLTAKDVSTARVAVDAVLRPGRLPALLKLAMQSRFARRNLTRCILETIDSLTVAQPVLTEVPG